MPRWSTSPDTVEECRIISMSKLKKLGYLRGHVSGPLVWSRGGKTSASIGITVHISDFPRYMRLQYTITNRFTQSKKDFNYLIPIEAFPSNLGNGYRYYFICPETEKRCIKLYQPPGASIFAHRDHWQDLFYENQIKSRRWRDVSKFFDLEERLRDTSTRYMKSHYRGKITPRYKAYLEGIQKFNKYSTEAIKALNPKFRNDG